MLNLVLDSNMSLLGIAKTKIFQFNIYLKDQRKEISEDLINSRADWSHPTHIDPRILKTS